MPSNTILSDQIIESQKMEPGQNQIVLEGINRIYNSPSGDVHAVIEISLNINKGEFLAIIGQSGSGKTTLMNLIAGIDTPTSGNVLIGGENIAQIRPKELTKWRGSNLGVVFQFFQLLPTLTILENIMLPMDFCNTYPSSERKERAMALLDKMGIEDQANKFPAYLSGGQKQRAALARALANDPPILCADEPTGNLDTATSDNILNIFQDLAKEGKTILMVTHERDISTHASRIIELSDGKLVNDRRLA